MRGYARPGGIGFEAAELKAQFTGCALATRVANDAGVDVDERGAPIELCAATRAPWSQVWSGLRHLG